MGGAILAAPASALQLGPEAPHSPNTEDMATAYWVMIVVTLVVLVAINAALIAGAGPLSRPPRPDRRPASPRAAASWAVRPVP